MENWINFDNLPRRKDGKIDWKNCNHNLVEFSYNGVSNSFYIEKDSTSRTIIFVPEDNDKLKQIFITNARIEDPKQIEVKAGMNALIYLGGKNVEQKGNYFQTFSSPVNNIRFISFKNENKNEKYLYNHYWEKYLYIDKYDTDIYINSSIHYFHYTFFSILNEKTLYYFKNFIRSKKIYINKRLNTDNFKINDFINLYVDDLNATYNLYIKKYYGPIKIYESDYILSNFSDLTMLTKPIKNIKGKSIINKLVQLNKNQIITGYLSANSLIDIYLEKDNDNKDIYLTEFKNRKYLKKGIEYEIHFSLNHLVKLEPQFNAEIIIYNENTKIILNNKNETGILIGKNFKMIANNSAMIYFYPKTQKFQKRLEPKPGKIIEINLKIDYSSKYSIDFGFEGFEPPDMEYNYNYEHKLYIENIYDKLDINLAKGEYLFIYYDNFREDVVEVNYINNGIINSGYKYNFNLIRRNMTNKKYIIPNMNKKKTRIQINHCKSNLPYKLGIYYGDKFNYYFFDGDDKLGIYYEDKSNYYFFDGDDNYGEIIRKKYDKNDDYNVNHFLFESKNDFVLSYSYDDEKDEDYSEKNRILLNNLTINNISVINRNKININFNVNYKNSLTKYIIIITPEERNNTFENLKDFCFLTELINKKAQNFLSEEIYDIGENDTIDFEVDIPEIKCENKKCIINIISQELRFEKYLRFYEPMFFVIEKNEFIFTGKTIIILGFIVILILLYNYLRRLNKFKIKNNSRLKKYEEFFGVELDDSNAFASNKNN